jgi:hypothetical protein
MILQEFIEILENSDRLRVIKDDKEIFVGYVALFTMKMSSKEKNFLEQYKQEMVKKFRAVPEIRHKQWKKLNLMRPLEPDETPDFSFSDLQMSLYYTIYI